MSHRSVGGFTLLETMVALAILGTGIAAVLGLLATGTAATHRAHTRALLTELAEERLEMLVLDAASPAGAEGALEPPHQGLRWRTRVSRGPVAGTVLLEAMAMGEGDSVHLATMRPR